MFVKSKDLNGTEHTYSCLSENVKKELKTYGVLSSFTLSNQILYHLDLNSGSKYNTKVPYVRISFAKGRRTYGGIQDLWECAVLYRKGVKGVMGYMEENKLKKYVDFIIHLTKSQGWYQRLPYEFYQHGNLEFMQNRQEELLNEENTILPV